MHDIMLSRVLASSRKLTIVLSITINNPTSIIGSLWPLPTAEWPLQYPGISYLLGCIECLRACGVVRLPRGGTARMPNLGKWSRSKATLRAIELDAEITQGTQVQVVVEDKTPKVVKPRIDAKFHAFIARTMLSKYINGFIMITILMNAITIAAETTRDEEAKRVYDYFYWADYIFLGIYTAEAALKLYAEPRGYWRNGYNRFDFAIVIVSYIEIILGAVTAGGANLGFLKVVRALRALRALRSVSFIKSMQVLVNALLETIRSSVLDLLLLLFLGMFLFSIVGYYFFGYDSKANKASWGTVGVTFMSLFTYVTVDGWTATQDTINSYSGSIAYTIIFIFFGHFLFTNLFIGVIIQNIEHATHEYKVKQEDIKKETITKKKAYILERQRQEMKALLEKQRGGDFKSFQQMVKHLAGTLRHEDIVPMLDHACSTTWLDTFMTTLDYQENTMFRSQMLHFEIANTLAELAEHKLSGRTPVV